MIDRLRHRVPGIPGSGLLRLVAFLFLLPSIGVAQKDPEVGYAFPAGARRGTATEITIGGQNLGGAKRAIISGEGVWAKVLEHVKPLTQQELGNLRKRIRELEKELRSPKVPGKDPKKDPKKDPGKASGKGEEEPAPDAPQAPDTSAWPDLEGMTMKELAELRRKLFDPKKQRNPQIAELVRLRVTVAPDAALGLRELRIVGRSGVSNPIRFQIGSWAECREEESSDRRVDGGVLKSLPIVVNGQILPGDVDRFRFRGKKGQELVAATSARELIPYLADAVPGWFQAVLALYDTEGHELAFADDFRFHPDPVLHFVLPEDGEYILEIRDSIFRGREDFVYRIALGELPFVTSIFPLGGCVGTRTEVEVEGWNLSVDRLVLDETDGEAGVRAVRIADGEDLSNPVPFSVDPRWDCLEIEPNDAPDSAQPILREMTVNGRIEHPGDVDVFRIEGRAGEEIVVEVEARRLNSPLDSMLRLTDERGGEIAVNDDFEDRGAGLTTHHADSRLSLTLPADGSYYLRLVDVQQQGSAAHAYRLHVRPRRPDFELRVVPSSINIAPAGTVPLTIHALRRDGFEGEIELGLEGKSRGFTLSGGWVPEGQDRVRLTLTAPAAGSKDPVPLQLEGRATIEGREVRHRAIPAEDRMQAFLYRHLVPAEELLVMVRGKKRYGPPLVLLGERPLQIRAGGGAEVRFRGPRSPKEGKIEFELSEAPEGISIQRVSFLRGGVAIMLHADETVPLERKGNLIIDVVFVKTTEGAKGKPARTRRIPRGSLPAIPFEIVRR
jgi:hypothetical protein